MTCPPVLCKGKQRERDRWSQDLSCLALVLSILHQQQTGTNATGSGTPHIHVDIPNRSSTATLVRTEYVSTWKDLECSKGNIVRASQRCSLPKHSTSIYRSVTMQPCLRSRHAPSPKRTCLLAYGPWSAARVNRCPVAPMRQRRCNGQWNRCIVAHKPFRTLNCEMSNQKNEKRCRTPQALNESDQVEVKEHSLDSISHKDCKNTVQELIIKVTSFAVASFVCFAMAIFQPGYSHAGPLFQLPSVGQTASVDPLSDLSPEERSVVAIFESNTPSVVNITNVASLTNRFTLDVRKIPQGTGSGFIWDKQGHIVTNYHVIRGASELRVTTLDKSVYTTSVVGFDEDKDVAVLKLDCPKEVAGKLTPVTLGTSATLLVGQRVFAIGNPFGLDHTLTQGIISGLGRELDTGIIPIKGVIQTDAAINPGNSGGVLLNSKGRLIGINTAIADPTGKGSSSGVGFAIPIDTVKGLVDQILKYGRVMRPVLGVTIAPPQVLQQLKLEGVLILEVAPNSPAGKAGLIPTTVDQFTGEYRLGDIITGIDGVAVRNYKELFEVLDGKKVGQSIDVQVLRDNVYRTVKVVLGERKAALTRD